jgi:thiol-disulfide isomerase/thioredoxin
MKFNHFIIVILIISLSKTASADTAPNFPIKNIAGVTQLNDLKGQVIYLDFWASWCKPCRKSFPWMNSIQQKYSNRGFKLITINLDKDPALMNQFLEKYPAEFNLEIDPKGKIADLYKLQSMPNSFIIDTEGNIAFTHIGFFEKKQRQYEKEIESLLKK